MIENAAVQGARFLAGLRSIRGMDSHSLKFTKEETLQRSALSSRVRFAIGWHVFARSIAGIGHIVRSNMMDQPVLKGQTRGLRPEGVSPDSRRGKLSVTAALAAVIAAMADGTITTDDASAICAVVETQRRAIETEQLEGRMLAIESI